jgi:hypothetical protein
MNKISEIFRSWVIAELPSKEQAELAQKRLSICKECPSMVESVVFKFKCDECGCPIGKKIFTPLMGQCDLHKWDKVEK